MEHLALHESRSKTIPSKQGTFFRKKDFSPYFIQPKLTINQPNDSYEQEADAMADRVMRMTDHENMGQSFFRPCVPSPQRMCADCEEEEKMMQLKKVNGKEPGTNNELESYVDRLKNGGQPLPDEVRNFYEPRFGHDFSQVKVHTDGVAAKSAQSINALAYTSGNHIVFNQGQYSPDSASGKKLLGHELSHVVQQGQALTTSIHKQDDDVVAESEAMRDRFRADRRRDLRRIIDCNTFHKIRVDCPVSTGVRLADVLARMRTRVAGNPACIQFFQQRFGVNPDIMFNPGNRPSLTFVPLLGVSGRTRCPEPTCDSPIPSVSVGTASERDNICNSPHLERVIMHELTHYAHCYRRWGDTGNEATSEEGATICMGTVQDALDRARRSGTTVQPKRFGSQLGY